MVDSWLHTHAAAVIAFWTHRSHEEGFYHQGTRPQRNNNPGDIEIGKFALAHGAIGGDGLHVCKHCMYAMNDAQYLWEFSGAGTRGQTLLTALV